MAANPPLKTQGVISSRLADETVEIPAAWRTKQFVGIGIVLLLAAWYYTIGWHSPTGDSQKADSRSIFDLVGFAAIGALIWLTTPVAWTVAATTFQEAIRRKWMSALLGFAVVMLAISTFFTWMQPGEEQKFLRDYGIGFTAIMTLIAAIFLGVALIPPEIERRTIFTILSKPVTRLEFLIGKYIGLMITLLVNLAVMTVIFLLAYAWFVISREGIGKAFLADGLGVSRNGLVFDLVNLGKALFLNVGTLSIMAAVAITLSQYLSGITAIIASFIVYFVGQSASYWERLAGGTGAASEAARPVLPPALRVVVEAIYFVLPRLDRFEARERLVNDLPIGLNYIAMAGASGAIYTAVLLTVAYFSFSDREF
ncbi:ABC transporter permease [bacterium]|nr:MAG: ABC transporter permease [bacterium]